jgi:hypothetical protein
VLRCAVLCCVAAALLEHPQALAPPLCAALHRAGALHPTATRVPTRGKTKQRVDSDPSQAHRRCCAQVATWTR